VTLLRALPPPVIGGALARIKLRAVPDFPR